jgi:hypothetical protein
MAYGHFRLLLRGPTDQSKGTSMAATNSVQRNFVGLQWFKPKHF